MVQSIHTAASGMKAQQNKIDNIANNIANVNTTAFKQAKVDFTDAIYQTMLSPDEGDRNNNLQRGHGVLISGFTKDYNSGNILETGNQYDFVIDGAGFFTIDSGEKIMYTRDGSFDVNKDNFLVTKDGYYVLNDKLEKINTNNQDFKNEIGVSDFINPEGLISEGSNLLSASDASGDAFNIDNHDTKQYCLESSNVDLTMQLTDMIKAQRAYQAISRAVTLSDEMEGMANNLKR